jgi:uncharacterized protein YjdB
MLAFVIVPILPVQAASTPAISKKAVNVLIKDTYDLNIKNKIKGSVYVWSSSNDKIATVNNVGLVKGKQKGEVVITCKITAPDKKVYKLSSKVKVIYGAKKLTITNKVTVLNKGQVYDVNRKLTPANSNDVTTWVSSDTKIAKPDKLGKFTALKTGTVTITGSAISGASDSMTVKVVDEFGTVTSQKELDELLGSGVEMITLSTTDKLSIKIPAGKYKDTTLIVDAPNAEVYNYGEFKSIEIRKIAANTWHEEAQGNQIVISSGNTRIVVGENASVRIEVTAAGAKVIIENNGVVTEVALEKASEITITGKSTKPVPIAINSAGTKITSSVPIAVETKAPATLTLLKGAEKSTIAADKKENIPVIKGNVTMEVTVGSGDSAIKETVVGDKIDDIPPGPGGGGGGGGGSGGDNPPPVPEVTKTVLDNGKVRYALSKPYSDIKTIRVSYMGISYDVNGDMMSKLKGFLASETNSLDRWNTLPAVQRTYGGVTVKVSAANGSTRTVEFVDSILQGNKYSVTVSSDGTVSMTSLQSNKSFTIKKINNNTLEIDSNIDSLSFDPAF